ncbi:MAG: hypothetical protein LBB81_05485 [Treponema sp.]|jgi:hypothetical protein|nr:hypothetical protein [Treponema sp.]
MPSFASHQIHPALVLIIFFQAVFVNIIISREEAIHNPIPARTMPVSIVEDMALEEEAAIGTSIEL